MSLGSDPDPSHAPPQLPFPYLHPQEVHIVEEAVAAFLSQWSNPNVELWWDILNPTRLTSLQPLATDSLGTALQAVSVMTVALQSQPQSQPLMQCTAKIYGAALRSINFALQNPDECLQDNTMLAVILTALFEVRRPFGSGYGLTFNGPCKKMLTMPSQRRTCAV